MGLLNNIKKEGFKNIIVVDDGSSDATFAVVKKKAIVVKHLFNRGKVAVVKTGMDLAKKLNADYVITFDGDGQHNPKDIKKIVEKLNKGFEVILGNRFIKKNRMPFFNRLGNFLANILTYLIYGLWVGDSQSGFRGYNKKALDKLDLSSDQYEFDSEVIREIAYHQLKFCEVPIDVFYIPYSLSKKHKQNLVNGIKTLFNMIK